MNIVAVIISYVRKVFNEHKCSNALRKYNRRNSMKLNNSNESFVWNNNDDSVSGLLNMLYIYIVFD